MSLGSNRFSDVTLVEFNYLFLLPRVCQVIVIAGD